MGVLLIFQDPTPPLPWPTFPLPSLNFMIAPNCRGVPALTSDPSPASCAHIRSFCPPCFYSSADLSLFICPPASIHLSTCPYSSARLPLFICPPASIHLPTCLYSSADLSTCLYSSVHLSLLICPPVYIQCIGEKRQTLTKHISSAFSPQQMYCIMIYFIVYSM